MADTMLSPSLKVEHQHAGVEVRSIFRAAEPCIRHRLDLWLAAIDHGGGKVAFQRGLQQLPDRTVYEDITVKIEHASIASNQVGQKKPDVDRRIVEADGQMAYAFTHCRKIDKPEIKVLCTYPQVFDCLDTEAVADKIDGNVPDITVQRQRAQHHASHFCVRLIHGAGNHHPVI